MEVTSEQLITKVKVNRPGYSTSHECSEVNILGFSPTPRWIIILAYTKPVNQWIFVFLYRILKSLHKLRNWQLFHNSVTISASLEKFTHRMMLKNKTLPQNTQTKFCRFLFIDLDGFLIYFSNLSFTQTFQKPGRHAVTSMSSHAIQEYPRIFLDREPIRAHEKHYSVVWYMLMIVIAVK